jgi:hypothetical protein
MVDSYCPVEGNEAACGGDMIHFDLHKNAFLTIADSELGKLNVTFRMVACNHTGNIILKTKKKVSEYYYAFVIMNHIIGLKKVYYSFDNNNWIGLERQGDYNEWKIDRVSKLPIYLKFEAISGEILLSQINEIKSDFLHDTGVQFSLPKDMYFNVDSLKKVSDYKKEECCKLNDAFTNIYDEGKFLGEWQDISNCIRNLEYNSGCKERSNKCIKVELVNWSVFQFFNRIKPETKRYDSIEFFLKSEKQCDNCLKIISENNHFIRISTKAAGIWEKHVIKLNDLNITDDKFRKFMFQGINKDSQVFYFDDIKLLKSNYIDNGLCADSSGSNNENSDNKNPFITLVIVFLIIIGIISIFLFWRYKYKKDDLKEEIQKMSKHKIPSLL